MWYRMMSMMVAGALLLSSISAFGATARCVVVEKKGDVLVMNCGDRSGGFTKSSKVKIKTDRDKK